MAWEISQIGVSEDNLETVDAELSELWDLRIPKGLAFPDCDMDYLCLYRLIDLGAIWRITDSEHRVWLEVLDKRHVPALGCYVMQNLSLDCEEAIAFDAIQTFLKQFPEQVITPIPGPIAECELFQFWGRFAAKYGYSSEDSVIRYGGAV